ncbi:hypothetical protein V6N13_084435 [Hibiscus sabdariffa]|uniref:DUF2470 domain-containing protein n=1 Tax=Hibiscus sabdariffa TaxID=183260 RepID=A0ABR2T1T9_9ROSI
MEKHMAKDHQSHLVVVSYAKDNCNLYIPCLIVCSAAHGEEFQDKRKCGRAVQKRRRKNMPSPHHVPVGAGGWALHSSACHLGHCALVGYDF